MLASLRRTRLLLASTCPRGSSFFPQGVSLLGLGVCPMEFPKSCLKEPAPRGQERKLSQRHRGWEDRPMGWGGAQAVLWPGSGCLRGPPPKGLPVLYWPDHSGPSDLQPGECPILCALLPFPTNSAVCKNSTASLRVVVSCGSGVLPHLAMGDCGQGIREGVV